MDKDLKRGSHAEQLLRDELFNEAFDTVESAIIDKWKTCPIRDREGEHELKLMLVLLGDIKGYIVEVMNTGILARIGNETPAKGSIMNQPFNRS